MRRDCKAVGTVLSCAAALSGSPALGAGKTVTARAGRLETGVFDSGATEIPACHAPFLDPAGSTVATVPTGQDPDMLTFAPDGCRVLVANEGEPSDDNGMDPERSVSVIELSDSLASAAVRVARLGGINVLKGVRTSGPGATAAQDLEPESTAVSGGGGRASATTPPSRH